MGNTSQHKLPSACSRSPRTAPASSVSLQGPLEQGRWQYQGMVLGACLPNTPEDRVGSQGEQGLNTFSANKTHSGSPQNLRGRLSCLLHMPATQITKRNLPPPPLSSPCSNQVPGSWACLGITSITP